MDRATYLTSLIGKPWSPDGEGPDAYSCWGLARAVQHRLFARDLPSVPVPSHLTWRWMIQAIASHPERGRWAEKPLAGGIVTAGDGALVLMARADRPAHIGVRLAAEGAILHAGEFGVVLETMPQLRARGWGRLRFYEPVSS